MVDVMDSGSRGTAYMYWTIRAISQAVKESNLISSHYVDLYPLLLKYVTVSL